MTNNADQTVNQQKYVRHEGPRRHIIAFVLSIIFTALAFAGVIFAGESAFVKPFLIVLALIQAAFQLYIWMHMDQKGHEIPAIGIYFGFIVAVVAAITFVYWLGGY